MPRARNIKPSFFDNELLGDADPMVCLLFIGLWTLCDREGILEDRPKKIKGQLFTHREGLDVNGYLTELQRLEFICRYDAEGMHLIKVLNFKKHQSPHKTEKQSTLPDIPKDYKEIERPPDFNGALTVKQRNHNALIPDSGLPDSLIPDSGLPDSGIVDSEKSTPWDDSFEKFWDAFAYKASKGPAMKSWQAIPKKHRDLELILSSARSEAMRRAQRPDATPKMAQGWLTEKRWQDEIYTEPQPSAFIRQGGVEEQVERLVQKRENRLKVINHE